MTFNSLEFALFFIILYIIYLGLSHKWQNALLLAGSCLFYVAWDWRFLSLLFISITTDYICGRKIYESRDEKIKKRFLLLSIIVNLSILGLFKYCNFFISTMLVFLNHLGLGWHPFILKIALPLGISFYTLRTMSYTIDIYAEKLKPTYSYKDYALFVSFFPLLPAGPIMRAGDLLPQIQSPRKLSIDKFYEGCYLLFWGLFQKVVIADNLSYITNAVFGSPPPYNGVRVLMAIYAFAIQLYCDFAGYSNIAMGLGKCMGFDVVLNFNLPYFSNNPQDFWQRWHISLSSWLRDYLYYPIAFSKRNWGGWSAIFAIMVTFILCGLWHGATWMFVAWGAYWGVLLAAYMMLKPILQKIPRTGNAFSQRLRLLVKILFSFNLGCLGWLIFRAGTFSQAAEMLKSIFVNFSFVGLNSIPVGLFLLVLVPLTIELYQFKLGDQFFILKTNIAVRAVFYLIIFYLILAFGSRNVQPFVYVKF